MSLRFCIKKNYKKAIKRDWGKPDFWEKKNEIKHLLNGDTGPWTILVVSGQCTEFFPPKQSRKLKSRYGARNQFQDRVWNWVVKLHRLRTGMVRLPYTYSVPSPHSGLREISLWIDCKLVFSVINCMYKVHVILNIYRRNFLRFLWIIRICVIRYKVTKHLTYMYFKKM